MEAAARSPTYIECDPRCEWIKVGEFDALQVDVSGLGFRREELKVQVDTSRKLRISGERAVKDNQWRHFFKSFQLPKDCDIKGIKANFDKEILYVRLQKPVSVSKHRRLILTALVAIILVAGLGTYATYKFKYL